MSDARTNLEIGVGIAGVPAVSIKNGQCIHIIDNEINAACCGATKPFIDYDAHRLGSVGQNGAPDEPGALIIQGVFFMSREAAHADGIAAYYDRPRGLWRRFWRRLARFALRRLR